MEKNKENGCRRCALCVVGPSIGNALDTLEPLLDGVLAGISIVWFGQSRQITRDLDVEVQS